MHSPTESAEINVSFVESVALSSPCCPSMSVRSSHSSPSCPASVCDFAKCRDVLLGAKTFYLSAHTQTFVFIRVCVCIICISLCVYGMCIKLCICVYLRLVSGKPKRFKSACPKAFSSPTCPPAHAHSVPRQLTVQSCEDRLHLA